MLTCNYIPPSEGMLRCLQASFDKPDTNLLRCINWGRNSKIVLVKNALGSYFWPGYGCQKMRCISFKAIRSFVSHRFMT